MNHLQDFFEFWRKACCPKCKADNWIYDSHSQRSYPRCVDGCKCHACGHKFFIGDQFEFEARYLTEIEEYGLEKTLAEYLDYDEGKVFNRN